MSFLFKSQPEQTLSISMPENIYFAMEIVFLSFWRLPRNQGSLRIQNKRHKLNKVHFKQWDFKKYFFVVDFWYFWWNLQYEMHRLYTTPKKRENSVREFIDILTMIHWKIVSIFIMKKYFIIIVKVSCLLCHWRMLQKVYYCYKKEYHKLNNNISVVYAVCTTSFRYFFFQIFPIYSEKVDPIWCALMAHWHKCWYRFAQTTSMCLTTKTCFHILLYEMVFPLNPWNPCALNNDQIDCICITVSI